MAHAAVGTPTTPASKASVADIVNTGRNAMAGAINAALFLDDFVPVEHATGCTSTCSPGTTSARPGRPVGGEAQTLRTLLHYLEARFGA